MFTLFPPYDGPGQAGFHHLSDRPASLFDLGCDPGLWPNTYEGSRHQISITSPEALGSSGLGAWYDGTWPQEPTCT
jgi:hypothetical protein